MRGYAAGIDSSRETVGCVIITISRRLILPGTVLGLLAGTAASFFGPIRILQALAGTGILGGLIVFAITDTTRGRMVLASLVQIMTVGLIASILAFFGFERRGISLTAHKNSSLPTTTVGDYPRSVTWFKDRFIAVGVRASEQNGVKYRDGRVWQSSDGIVWNRVAHNHNVFGGLSRSDGSPSQRSLYAVATDGDKLIAVGSDNFEDAQARMDASFWSSLDGSTWTKIQNATTTTADGDQSLRGIAFGRGLWFAVGSISGRSDAALWSSSDGVQWVQEPEIAPRGVEITSIGFAKGQWIAVGKSYNTDPNAGRNDQYAHDASVWYSGDGKSWRSSSDSSLVKKDGAQGMNGVAFVSGRWVAVGSDDSSDPRSWDAAVWTSSDGRSWHRLPVPVLVGLDRGQILNAIAAGRESAIMLGHVLTQADSTPVVISLTEERLSGIDIRRGNTFGVHPESNLHTVLRLD